MNRRMILRTLGNILVFEGIIMLLPLLVSLIYKEHKAMYFLITIVVALAIGAFLSNLKTNDKRIYAKEGFIIVALSWIVVSLVGALPFYMSGEIPSYIDAFFETVSGFTTTGSSILNDIESLSKGMLFWRCFTHWIGGMGVLVFVLAFLPQSEGQNMFLMKAEVPGPVVGKLVSKVKMTARILYAIYAVLTLLEIVFLLLGKMPLYDSIVHAFSTAGTGGYSIKNSSIAYYDSYYIHMVISVFMLLFGVNFNLYYLLLLKDFKQILKSEELKCYLLIVLVFTSIITVNTLGIYGNVAESFRYSLFQVASIITTTGFATADFNLWPSLSKVLILLLMVIGACAGSTGGGMKISRVMILIKSAKSSIKKMISPRSVTTIKIEGKSVDKQVLDFSYSYFVVYALILLGSMLLISFENLDMVTIITAPLTCLGNVGPGLGEIIGPVGNFSSLSNFSKLILSFDMLAGRLELFPMIMLCYSFKEWISASKSKILKR
ncbi:MAG: TrkH family potassium uptake protein [Intestinibacter sp.]|uniref:TrkH family potassium uptake protein n=1 Tax=Intestinibacter sp. TaxID=1965304 RepID=UPI003F1693EB